MTSLGMAVALSLTLQGPTDPGALVRVTAPSALNGSLEGTIVAWRQDTLIVRQRDKDYTVPIATLTKFEVPDGHRVGAGLAYGAGIGTLAGIVIGLVVPPGSDCATNTLCPLQTFDRGSTVALDALGFGILGSVIGLIAGAVTPDFREIHPIPRQPVSAVPVFHAGPSGLQLGASVSF